MPVAVAEVDGEATTSHTTKRIQVSTDRLSINQKLATAMRIGIHGLPGILKARGRSGRFLRIIGWRWPPA